MATDPDEPTQNEEPVVEIFTMELGSIPTRVIVVEELCNCGLISKKRMRKRIQQIMADMELRSVEIETLPAGGEPTGDA